MAPQSRAGFARCHQAASRSTSAASEYRAESASQCACMLRKELRMRGSATASTSSAAMSTFVASMGRTSAGSRSLKPKPSQLRADQRSRRLRPKRRAERRRRDVRVRSHSEAVPKARHAAQLRFWPPLLHAERAPSPLVRANPSERQNRPTIGRGMSGPRHVRWQLLQRTPVPQSADPALVQPQPARVERSVRPTAKTPQPHTMCSIVGSRAVSSSSSRAFDSSASTSWGSPRLMTTSKAASQSRRDV